MKSIKKKNRLQHQKLKILFTLDNIDIALTKDNKQLGHRKKLISFIQRPRTNAHSKSVTKSQINAALKSKQKALKQNLNNDANYQMRSINTDTKKKSSFKSRQRIKTQYDEGSPKKITLSNLDIFTTIKNVKFHMDEQYNVDPFYIVDTIKSTKEETVYTVKYLDRDKKYVHYIMKKSNHPKTIQKYERQIAIKEQMTDNFKSSQRKNFSCIYKVYKKDQNQNLYLVYYMEGLPLSWKKPVSKKFIHNLPKNNMEILRHLIVQISKAIYILSSHGYYHSQLRLKSILLELKQDEENVKVSKVVKLGSLTKCQKIKDKKQLELMPHSIYTPPQILNFIMFQKQFKNFSRCWLQYIYKYEDAWRINVWSLGVLILELLNEEPLHNNFIDIQEIIQFQKQIELKCAKIFEKINDECLQRIIKKMLSVSPRQRPSPEQIIISLTS